MTETTLTMTMPTDSPVKGVGPAKTKAIVEKYSHVIAAIQAGETSSWMLADALVAEVAPGMDEARKADYEDVIARLNELGIDPGGHNHLRQVRRVGQYWPAGRRFAGVSFSAHRYATDDTLGVDKSAQLIQEQLDQHGVCTVTAIRQAVQLAKGNTTKAETIADAGKSTKRVSFDASTSDGSTGATNGDAITRAIAQVRALTSEILGEAASEDLETLRKVASNLIGRIDKIVGRRETEEARAKATPANVGKGGKSKSKSTAKGAKSTNKSKSKSTAGMRG